MKAILYPAALLALACPAAGWAQVSDCSSPTAPQPVHPELPSAEQPARIVPIGGYTLAITWTPRFCREEGTKPSARFECGTTAGGRFGFVLHGLWPDGIGDDLAAILHHDAAVAAPRDPRRDLHDALRTVAAARMGEARDLHGGI